MLTRNFKETNIYNQQTKLYGKYCKGIGDYEGVASSSWENKVTSKFCHQVASGASGKLFRKVVGAFVFCD